MAQDLIRAWLQGFARLVLDDARWAVSSLLSSFGTSTEPDFRAVGAVYDRVLAISLLLLGAVIATAIMERVLGGRQGAALSLVPRVAAGVAIGYLGLGLVEYASHYAGLVATTWSPDFAAIVRSLQSALDGSTSGAAATAPANPHHFGLLGLVMAALLLDLLAVLVHIELLARAALLLLVTSFLPLIGVFSIWARMAASAIHVAEFLGGLLISKFVMATAIYIGFSLVLPSLTAQSSSDPAFDWLGTGIAVFLIAALSPMVLFSALRLAEGSAAGLVRGWGLTAISFTPLALSLGKSAVGLGRTAAGGGRRALSRLAPLRSRIPGRRSR